MRASDRRQAHLLLDNCESLEYMHLSLYKHFLKRDRQDCLSSTGLYGGANEYTA